MDVDRRARATGDALGSASVGEAKRVVTVKDLAQLVNLVPGLFGFQEPRCPLATVDGPDPARRLRLVAAPASLLALCAWQAGNGALAQLALDRPLDDNPGYPMARLLRDAVTSAASPSLGGHPVGLT
jgi:hypothetical protein